jgi:hypothetical protein
LGKHLDAKIHLERDSKIILKDVHAKLPFNIKGLNNQQKIDAYIQALIENSGEITSNHSGYDYSIRLSF